MQRRAWALTVILLVALLAACSGHRFLDQPLHEIARIPAPGGGYEALRDGYLLVLAGNRHLRCYRTADGSALWEVAVPSEGEERVWSTGFLRGIYAARVATDAIPLVVARTKWVARGADVRATSEGAVVYVSGGQIRWKFGPLYDPYPYMSEDGRWVLINALVDPFDEKTLVFLIDAESGQVVWHRDLAGAARAQPHEVSGEERVLITSRASTGGEAAVLLDLQGRELVRFTMPPPASESLSERVQLVAVLDEGGGHIRLRGRVLERVCDGGQVLWSRVLPRGFERYEGRPVPGTDLVAVSMERSGANRLSVFTLAGERMWESPGLPHLAYWGVATGGIWWHSFRRGSNKGEICVVDLSPGSAGAGRIRRYAYTADAYSDVYVSPGGAYAAIRTMEIGQVLLLRLR